MASDTQISPERLAELRDWIAERCLGGECQCIPCDIDRALRELQALRARDGWQPIETAPKDGSRILLAANVHDPSGLPRISVGRYTDEPYWTPATGVIGAESGFQCDGDDCIPSNQEAFTHWQPLPTPPLAAAEKGKVP